MSTHTSLRSSLRDPSAFTLIELLIVIAIIAILAVVVVLTLNPAQLLSQSRDTNRVSDMNTLENAISLASFNGLPLGTASTVYVSVPDSSPTCTNLGLPALPTGWTYACAPTATYTKADGTGWIPVSLTDTAMGASLPKLPVDPVNKVSSCLYYTYTTNGRTFDLTTGAESQKEKASLASASSTYPDLFSVGTNVSLEPIDYASNCSTTGSGGGGLQAGTIAFNVSTTMSTTLQNQSTSLTFSGTAGQTMSMLFDNGASDTYPNNQAYLAILNPSGGTIVNTNVGNGTSGGVITSGITLPTTGTYTVRLLQTGSTAGSVTVKMITYTDITGGTISFGASTTMSTANIGQTESLTFSGTAGQTMSMLFDNGASDTYPNNQAYLAILNPSGGTIVNTNVGNGTSGGVITSGITLPTTGTYTVRLTQTGNTAGSVTVKMITYTDITGGTISFGASTTMSTANIGQTESLTFSGTAGQTMSMLFDNGASDTYPNNQAYLAILNPSGGTIVNTNVGNGTSGGVITSGITLPTTGTYTVRLTQTGNTAGSVTVKMITYTDITGGTISFGASTTMSTANIGQTESLTFSGTAGQTMSMLFDNGASDTYPNNQAYLAILNPSGGTIVNTNVGNGTSGGVITSGITLPTTGTYTVRLTQTGNTAGSVTVKMTTP